MASAETAPRQDSGLVGETSGRSDSRSDWRAVVETYALAEAGPQADLASTEDRALADGNPPLVDAAADLDAGVADASSADRSGTADHGMPDRTFVADQADATPVDLAAPGQLLLIAGNPTAALASGPIANVSLVAPEGLAADATGTIYISDRGAHLIRKLVPGSGTMTTLAGSGIQARVDGTVATVRYFDPLALDLGPDGALYVADQGASVVCRTASDGTTSTYAGQEWTWVYQPGPLASSSFGGVAGIAWASGALFVINRYSGVISRIESGASSWFSGAGIGFADGPAASAQFGEMEQLTSNGDFPLYAADPGEQRVRRIASDGSVTSIGSGSRGYLDGPVNQAQFNFPVGVAVSADGATVYVADSHNDRIRVVAAGQVQTLAGSTPGFADGTGAAARFLNPRYLRLTADNSLLVADSGNGAIRSVSPAGVVTTLAGSPKIDGRGTAARFREPFHGTLGADGALLVVDGHSGRVRRVSPTGEVSTVAGDGHSLWDPTWGVPLAFDHPAGVAVDTAGNLYVVGTGDAAQAVLKLTPGGVASRLAGGRWGSNDGQGDAARFRFTNDIAFTGGYLYVADRGTLRRVSLQGEVVTIAGSTTTGLRDGQGSAARFDEILALAVDLNGDLLAADSYNKALRRITPGGLVSTVARFCYGFKDGPVASACVGEMAGLAVGPDGTIYIADWRNHAVRALGTDKILRTLVGDGTAGFVDGPVGSARLRSPTGLVLTADGRGLYVIERDNHSVRLLLLQ